MRRIGINCFITACFLLPLFLSAQAGKPANGVKAAKVKTAYIYKFTDKIFWPAENLMKEFVIGVMSSPILEDQLKELETAVLFRKRIPIKVIRCNKPSDAVTCNLVVVDAAGGHNLWAIYSAIKGKPVLMVTENLSDFRKSMISFVFAENKLHYIVNKTKLQEANFTVKEELYTFAVTKEGEWKSIFEKFDHLLHSDDREVGIDKSDIAQFVSEYKSLENEKDMKELTIRAMEDSVETLKSALQERSEEYRRLTDKIKIANGILRQQAIRMETQKQLIESRDIEIGQQQTVIIVVAALSGAILLLFLLAIRVNGQRKKANRLLSLQKTEIEKQKTLIEVKQKEILDSINYAQRIQSAVMSNETAFRNHLPEYFIVFKPKDIVAGDFFWAAPLKDGFMYITADSTGHGVPGAFMSLLNISKLNEAVNQKGILRPDLVLNDVKRGLITALNPEGSTSESKDGMDATLCRLDLKTMKLQFAAANNSFCIVRNQAIMNCRADKMPVGKSHDDNAVFTFNELSIRKGDMIYTFTDGYTDQFGGPKGKKLKHNKLRELLLTAAELPMEEQKALFQRSFDEWRGSLEQVDDVLLIGVRI